MLGARVIEWTARALAAEGCSKIALFGAGRHTKPIVRQPWAQHGMTVSLIFDDEPAAATLSGVRVCSPAEWLAEYDAGEGPGFDALVVSSFAYEERLARRAVETLGDALHAKGVRIVRPYEGSFLEFEAETVRMRLCEVPGISEADAEWLVLNRDERHDATLTMIPPERTEFHLRRYELAADVLRELERRRVADIACGVGYGARMLCAHGQAEMYVGVDLNAQAVDYARRRHGDGEHVVFRNSSAVATGFDSDSVDLIASFETIEHIEGVDEVLREFARVLCPGGALIISTPNKLGPTPHHVHDFDLASFGAALRRWFQVDRWLGQLPVDEVYDAELPPGIFELDPGSVRAGEPDRHGRVPHALIAVCSAPVAAAADPGVCRIETRHGPILFACPSDLARWRAETLLTKEPETLKWIERFDVGDVFWDVGANVGPYTLYAAATGKPSRILAFEPSPWNAALLAENIQTNGFADRIEAYSIALNSETCPGSLFMRHTEPASAGSSFAEPVGEFGETFKPEFKQAALGVRLDDMVRWGAPTPNRLKIDVDGAEERVLAGAVVTLANPALKSVSLELDDSRADLIERVTAAMNAGGLVQTAKLHSPQFAAGYNASIYNYHFDRH